MTRKNNTQEESISPKKEGDSANVKANISYVLNLIAPSLQISKYKPGFPFPSITCSLSTFKNTYYRGNTSDKTLEMFANAFTSALREQDGTGITLSHLKMPHKKFAELFSENKFTKDVSHSDVKLDLFVNKLYRCYFMVSSSPSNALMGYFKLYKTNDKMTAIFLRGIQDFELIKELLTYFYSVEELHKGLDKLDQKFKTDKRLESLLLYEAYSKDISITSNRIKIDFHSIGSDDPCYCTMFWNINIPNNVGISNYIGGSALMVDTNDGKRGRVISAYKIGLEATENTGIPGKASAEPIRSDADELIQLLQVPVKNGVMAIDNADDDRWYRFLQDYNSHYTNNKSTDQTAELIKALNDLKNEISDIKQQLISNSKKE